MCDVINSIVGIKFQSLISLSKKLSSLLKSYIGKSPSYLQRKKNRKRNLLVNKQFSFYKNYLIVRRSKSQWIRMFFNPLFGNDPIISKLVFRSIDSKKSNLFSRGEKPVLVQNLFSLRTFDVDSWKSIDICSLAKVFKMKSMDKAIKIE